jgi:hypothetical protein
MSASNQARFEEGTEITVDAEVEASAAGWTLNLCHVVRVGGLVAVHIEATNDAGAAATVCHLQGDFAPAAQVADSSQAFTVGTDGTVSFTGDRSGSAKRVLQVSYVAGAVSP